jgi:hypothetical protein
MNRNFSDLFFLLKEKITFRAMFSALLVSALLAMLVGFSYFFLFSDGAKHYSVCKEIQNYFELNPLEKQRIELEEEKMNNGKLFLISEKSPRMLRFYRKSYEDFLYSSELYAFITFVIMLFIYIFIFFRKCFRIRIGERS